MGMTLFQRWLKEHKAPPEMKAWVNQRSFREAWAACNNAAWMAWWLERAWVENTGKEYARVNGELYSDFGLSVRKVAFGDGEVTAHDLRKIVGEDIGKFAHYAMKQAEVFREWH